MSATHRVVRSALALAALSVPSALIAQQLQRSTDSTFSWSGKVAAGATLAVRTYKGDVSVRAATGDVAEIRGVKREGRWSRRRSDDVVEFQVSREGQDVLVCAVPDDAWCDIEGMNHRHRGGNDGDTESVNFTVLLPRGVKLLVSSGNGDVDVTGAGADVRASSGNGEVRISDIAGGVKASSGNGAVSVEGARGPVSATSGNGGVMVSTASGPVTARSGNGNIEVSMAALSSTDDMVFSTGNGSITITVPANFEGEIDANQPHGEIRSDFPITITNGRIGTGRLRGTIGKGGRRIKMTTGNGRIAIRRAA